MDYVPYAVPFFLLAILIELAYGIIKNNNTYRLNDAISSLFMGSLRSANKLIIISFGGYIFYLIETHNSLWRMDATSPLVWIFAFVIYDFFYNQNVKGTATTSLQRTSSLIFNGCFAGPLAALLQICWLTCRAKCGCLV